MQAKSKKPFLLWVKKILLYGGTLMITLVFSYLFIIGTQFVNTGINMIVYTIVMFVILPILAFLVISLYMYVLERFIAS